ncbi:natural killer cells antigen CD94-like [Erinaceus europaeus]|uniref:Natural killer cells antigen CD94 n=1 Tax=Erinaceus europaeus TaxID=9365 RepID=A0ABM3XKT6_ERIEU|nr:natural killer cells antigen CD94-like [Erinaceus europaeus]
MAAFRTTMWWLFSGILGIICLLLVAVLGILLKNILHKQSIQSTTSPGPTMELQKDTDCCFCQERWIGYKYSCYYISNELKTWKESSHFCSSQNSTLLHLLSEQELNFMKNNARFYWIGIFYSIDHNTWLWENGSAFPPHLFSFSHTKTGNCIVYSPRAGVWRESCLSKNRYICKKDLA